MNRIRAFYRDLSLRNKLRFSYTLLILIPVTLLCIAYYWAASRSILDIAQKNILDVTVKNMQIIDEQLEAIEAGAVQLNVDPDLFFVLRGLDNVADSDLLAGDRRIKAVLQKYFSEDAILSVNIMTPRFVFGDNSQFVIPGDNFFDSGIYEQILGKRGEVQWIPTYRVEQEYALDFSMDEKTVFSLIQELNPVWIDPERPNNVEYLEEETEAVLVVNLKEDLMRDMFEGSNSVEGSYYCVASSDGVIVSHSREEKSGTTEALPWMEDAEENRSGSVVLNYQGQQVVVCYSRSAVTGWVAAFITPVNSLLNNVSRIQLLTVVVWIVLFLLAMLLSNVFSRRITRRSISTLYSDI